MSDRLDTPRANRRRLLPRRRNKDAFGKAAEAIATFMGTPRFLLYMTLFCGTWLAWNSLAPESLQFDPRALNFTLLTLMLSLQASYAAPLILLAQDRQTDRDRVTAEQDRQRAERNLADTEFLAREMASLRLALNDVATRDFVRSELRSLLEELQAERAADERTSGHDDHGSAESTSAEPGEQARGEHPVDGVSGTTPTDTNGESRT